MKYSPHDYQRYAAEFIITHPISALLLDMGLGKTSITLTAINDLLFDSFDIHKAVQRGCRNRNRTSFSTSETSRHLHHQS